MWFDGKNKEQEKKQKTAIERTHLTGGKKSTGTSARSIRVRHQPPRRFGTADA